MVPICMWRQRRPCSRCRQSTIELDMGRTMKWLLTRFYPDEKERATIKLEDIISNLMAALTTRNKGFFSRQMVENIICKVFRQQNLKKSDKQYFKVLFPGQNLYLVQQNYVRVMSADGKQTYKAKHPLLEKVLFWGKYITTKELRMRIPESWPGWDPTVNTLGWSFLAGIFDSSRDEYPQTKFDRKCQFDFEDRSTRNIELYKSYKFTQARLLE